MKAILSTIEEQKIDLLFLILLILGLVIIIETGIAAALFLCGGGRKLGNASTYVSSIS